MILFFGILIKFGIIVELITAIIGTCYYYKYKHVPILKYFVVLLWYVVFNESMAYYILDFSGGNNAIVYNIYYIFSFGYLILLYNYFLKSNSKTIISSLFSLYLLSIIINGFYENYLTDHMSIPHIIGAAVLIIAIILYFIEILNSKQVLYTDKILLFWISFGLLLYYVGTIPFRILLNYYESKSDATVSFFLNFSLTIIMNLFFIIGFVWSNDKQKG